jgi:pimeloyl-ACP methyl ester carboxylesterase
MGGYLVASPFLISMFPNFLPTTVTQLTEPSSIAIAQNIQQAKITIESISQAISTSYIEQKSGNSHKCLLLIHGFDSSILEFRRLLPLLGSKHDVCAVDLLGFGFTERAKGIKYDTTSIKTHLYEFWKTHIHKPIILVGASMGGAAALDFTLTYPEVVEKLVLIDSAGLIASSSLVKFMFPPLGYFATEFLRNPKIRQSISSAAYKNKKLASLDAQICAALHLEATNWSQALIAFTKSGGYRAFTSKQLSQIQQQTLVLWGDSDGILGIKDAEKFQQAIPNSKLIWVPDCGHVPHLEQPEITSRHIIEFCAS